MNEEVEKIVDAEKLEIDLGDENSVFVANNGNYFGIAFDKLFGQPQLNVYNTFEMTSKRNFKNLTPTIIETYEELFFNESGVLNDEAELVFFNFLKIKADLMITAANNEFTSYDKFMEQMEEIIESGDRALYNIIDSFIESNYSLNLDKITQDTKDKKRKVNTELQFSDAHAKDLLKIAYLYRTMIPIISVYFYYNKTLLTGKEETAKEEELEDMEFDDVNSSIFAYLFDKFATKPDALRNKLYRLTYSGVSKTTYSDKRFWLAAKNVAITEKTEALEIYKKILTNAIPKLSIDGDKNVISFLQSVINNQVDFLFQNKFKYRFTPLGNTETKNSTAENDDEELTEFERVEIQQSRKDEGSYLIRKLNIKDVLESIPERLNVGICDAEVKDLMGKLKRNQIQENIISLLTFKYFDDKDALKFIDFYQYCYLVLCCKKYLQQQKFIYLPLILTSTCEKHRERANISGKKVRPEILQSKKYTDMIEEKYKNFAEEIEKPFLAFIGTVYSSTFKNEKDEEIFDGSVKVGKIAEELVTLAKLI